MARLTNKQSDSNKRKASSYETDVTAQPKDTVQAFHDIPKFDLAEQILAEQRKLSSVRRKGPGKRTKDPTPKKVHPIVHIVDSRPMIPEQERIITEIVTRDIEKLIEGR